MSEKYQDSELHRLEEENSSTDPELFYPEGGWRAWATVLGAYVPLSDLDLMRYGNDLNPSAG
jgi:hypothetical protein